MVIAEEKIQGEFCSVFPIHAFEELQVEEMSVDKLVLKGQREDCVYTLCKVNDTKKEALLKAGDEARLADIEDYVEGSNLN